MEKYFIAKSENYPNIVLDIKYEDYKRFYSAHAKNLQGEEMGFVNFNFGTHERTTWIWKIETQEQFQHQGVGSVLLSYLEYESYNHRYYYVEGKYFPSNAYAKPFYEKMNYTFDVDGYDQFISKFLTPENIIPFTVTEVAAPEESTPEENPER